MVRSVGFKPTSFFRFACDQSTYCVESAVFQNSRSSSSLLNLGISLKDPIDFCFIVVHVPHRDHPDQVGAYRESRKEQSPKRRLSKGVVSLFGAATPHVRANHQWFVEEHLFRLFGGNPVKFPILFSIELVPLKSYARLQRIPSRHPFSISLRYTHCFSIRIAALFDRR